MFRIKADPNGERIEGQASKGPLLLMHGFLNDSLTWFTNLSDENELAIGTQLFQEGYDVWFGNVRGTKNSREHLELDPEINHIKYWDFSVSEFGKKDLPAMLNTIKQNQDHEFKCKKISYVGHSQGTMMAFYGLSHAPYASKYLSQFVALAPCFIGNADMGPDLDKNLFLGIE